MIDLVVLVVAVVAIGAGVHFSQNNHEGSLPNVLVISASDTHGGYFDASNQLCRLTPTPCEMIAKSSGLSCFDETLNGLQLHEQLVGGNVAFAAPDPGQSAVVKPLQVLLDDHPDCSVVYMGLGMNDVLFGGRTIEQHLTDVETAVSFIRHSGKRPVLRGFHQFQPSPLMTPEKIEISSLANMALIAKAQMLGVDLCDVASVSCGGMQPDGLHPDAEYQQRLCEFQAAHLASVARRV